MGTHQGLAHQTDRDLYECAPRKGPAVRWGLSWHPAMSGLVCEENWLSKMQICFKIKMAKNANVRNSNMAQNAVFAVCSKMKMAKNANVIRTDFAAEPYFEATEL